MRSPKNALPYTVGEDTIYGVDFPGGIAEALSRRDYREAVRLLYLQTLKQLSDAERIDWQLYKTPTQYLNEVRLPAFRQLTNHFCGCVMETLRLRKNFSVSCRRCRKK